MYREETAVHPEVTLVRSKPDALHHGQKSIPCL